MGLVLLALFILVPVIEIFGFIQIGGLIGLWPTMGIVILTAIVGSFLLRHQGLNTLLKAEQKLHAGEVPVDQLVDGIGLAFAGALLLTPGFFTDAFGFLLFVPPFRRSLAKMIFSRFISPRFRVFTNFDDLSGEMPFEKPPTSNEGPIIDGTFEAKNTDETQNSKIDPIKNDPSSPWHK